MWFCYIKVKGISVIVLALGFIGLVSVLGKMPGME